MIKLVVGLFLINPAGPNVPTAYLQFPYSFSDVESCEHFGNHEDWVEITPDGYGFFFECIDYSIDERDNETI